MREYCDVTPETKTEPGTFIESEVVTKSGLQWHLEHNFIEELACFLMARYESQPVGPRLVLRDLPRDAPKRTKHFYRRFFDGKQVTYEFKAWASETLALWLEQDIDTALHSEGGPPHNNDPAFDVISVVYDSDKRARLRIVQVKATKENLQGNAAGAGAKFKALEGGEYDSELSARLDLIAYKASLPSDIDVRSLIYEPEKQYRLTAIHGQDRRAVQILTKYSVYVSGSEERRSVRLMRIEWDEFWTALGEAVYAQLA